MPFLLRNINLMCVDLHKLSAFVSFLFDVEIHFDSNIHYFFLGKTRFNLVQAHAPRQSIFSAFELCAESVADLKNFQRKFELFLYKSHTGELKASFTGGCFEFEDPSGNLWKISAEKAQTASKTPATLSPVR